MVTYLSGRADSPNFVRLYAFFGDEFLLFLSIFGGTGIRIPTVPTLIRMKQQCNIYIFLSRRGFTEGAFLEAAKKFRRRVEALVTMVEQMDAQILRAKV